MNYDDLVAALGDDALDAGITYRSYLEPLGGPGAPVKPAVYAGNLYQKDRRWLPDASEAVDVLVIDNVPSQANRMEAALGRVAATVGLPVIELDLSGVGDLPPHVPDRLTSFEFPHRQADAYLRDSLLADTGEKFPKTKIGEALNDATPTRPEALLRWMPQALVFGFWQSHLGKKKAQTKFARALTSEIVGYEPATTETRRLGIKGDPLNLSVESAVDIDPDDLTEWDYTTEAKSGKAKSKESLSEIGHGQVPVRADQAPLGPVSFRLIEQLSTLSFARLRNVEASTAEQSVAARALLAALGVLAMEEAFGGGFTLRSGADLRPVERTVLWVGEDETKTLTPLGRAGARGLFAEAVAAAERAGLPVGSEWAAEPLKLVPGSNLAKVIRATFGLEAE